MNKKRRRNSLTNIATIGPKIKAVDIKTPIQTTTIHLKARFEITKKPNIASTIEQQGTAMMNARNNKKDLISSIVSTTNDKDFFKKDLKPNFPPPPLFPPQEKP